MSDDLKNQLAREADAMSPAFDESLHAKTMSRVMAARREALAAAVRVEHPAVGRLWFAGKIATGLFALALGIGVYTSTRGTRVSVADADQFHDAIAQLEATTPRIDATFDFPMNTAKHQLVLLREDASALGEFFVGQLNVLPVEDPGL